MESRNSDKSGLDNSSSYDDSDGSEYDMDNNKMSLKASENRNYHSRIKNAAFDTISFERMPTRQPKCFTKNAVMARQNRLRKKKYVEDLESQVTKLKQDKKSLSSILNNQSNIIIQLRKELKYIKSVLANSSDISKLLKSINHNTGMSVSTSLDKSLMLKTNSVKMERPCDDIELDDCFLSPDISSAEFGFLFNDSELCIEPIKNSTLDFKENEETIHSNMALKEHNYTINTTDEDAGVCLHVSKHRVSLEFCSTCSDNSIQAWNDID